MLLYRICKRCEIDYKTGVREFKSNKTEFTTLNLKNHAALLEDVRRHITVNEHKNKLHKPYKSFSKCPILLLSYLLMHESYRDDLSVIAIELSPTDINTLEYNEGSIVPIQNMNTEMLLSSLDLKRVCIDSTNKEVAKMMGIHEEGMRSKYGPSKAEVVIYSQEPIEIKIEIPATFFIEAFMKFRVYIDNCGELKINQDHISNYVWEGIDKRYKTDTGIKKTFYENDVKLLVNDYVRSMPLIEADNHRRCAYLANLYSAVDVMYDGKSKDSDNYPNNRKIIEERKSKVTSDWCRGCNCQKYYT